MDANTGDGCRTADQLIPVEHGRKLAEDIPDPKGLWLEGVDHIFSIPNMDALIEHIISDLLVKNNPI